MSAEQEVAVSKRDQPDVVLDGGRRSEASVVIAWVVIVREDQDVYDPETGEIQLTRRRQR